MTENEAKEWIEYLGNKNLPYDRSPISRKLACDIAIQALEEIQAYRAIGTVEDLQDMKNKYQEAVIDWRQYRKVGTIEEFKALKEKNEPKKIVKRDTSYKCPICNSWVGFRYRYCDWCGQALDWE